MVGNRCIERWTRQSEGLLRPIDGIEHRRRFLCVAENILGQRLNPLGSKTFRKRSDVKNITVTVNDEHKGRDQKLPRFDALLND